jgi:hypothetical protein
MIEMKNGRPRSRAKTGDELAAAMHARAAKSRQALTEQAVSGIVPGALSKEGRPYEAGIALRLRACAVGSRRPSLPGLGNCRDQAPAMPEFAFEFAVRQVGVDGQFVQSALEGGRR